GRAVNVVALATALQIIARDRKWKLVCNHAVLPPRVQQFVQVKMAARDCPGNRRTLGAPVTEKLGRFVGQILRLNVHVEPAPRQQYPDHAETGDPALPRQSALAHASPSAGESGLRLQSRILHESAGFQEMLWSAPVRISYRAPLRTGKTGPSTPARTAPR